MGQGVGLAVGHRAIDDAHVPARETPAGGRWLSLPPRSLGINGVAAFDVLGSWLLSILDGQRYSTSPSKRLPSRV
jgi:hypothetical protein